MRDRDLSPTAAAALARIVAENGATLHPSTARALMSRGLARQPFWNRPNYLRPTPIGTAAVLRARREARER